MNSSSKFNSSFSTYFRKHFFQGFDEFVHNVFSFNKFFSFESIFFSVGGFHSARSIGINYIYEIFRFYNFSFLFDDLGHDFRLNFIVFKVSEGVEDVN